MYTIEFTKKATKGLRAIDIKLANDLMKKIKQLSENPYSKNIDVKKLKGLKNVYRLRYGEYRVIYEINNRKLVITVIKLGIRGDIYG